MTTPENRAPLSPASEDELLVERVLAGEIEAFALLMRRYNQRLYRLVRGITGDDASAEDVLQQTYVSAYRHLAQLDGRARFAGWIRRIAVREALRQRQDTTRRQVVYEEAEQASVIPFPTAPETRLSAREWARILGQAIDELPDPYRIVLTMRKLEQMSTEETAEALSLSPENVRIRLHRARRLIADRLYERFGDAADEIYEFGGVQCDRIVMSVIEILVV